MNERPLQRVVCAAIRHRDTGHIICSARHFDPLMHQQIKAIGGKWNTAEQGFIDQFGTFLTREKAHFIATKRGQIFRRCGGDDDMLFSENLY